MAGRPKLMVAVTGYPNPYPKSQVFKKLNTTIENAVKPFAIGCISDLIFEADTLEPGITTLKWKLGIPKAPNSNICQ